MWQVHYELSYTLLSSIQIFIFSGDYKPMGIGNEILSLLPLIFHLKWSPVLQEKKKKPTTLLSSQFSLAALCKRVGRYCQNCLCGKIAKLRSVSTLVSLLCASYFLRVFLLSPHIPKSLQCTVQDSLCWDLYLPSPDPSGSNLSALVKTKTLKENNISVAWLLLCPSKPWKYSCLLGVKLNEFLTGQCRD